VRSTARRGCRLLGWRDVPVDDSLLRGEARRTRPAIRQLFIAPGSLPRETDDASPFERALYVLRRVIERRAPRLYIASMSSRTIVYKGLLRADQLGCFYGDLASPETASGLAVVHSRFATNTFPSWARAHPYRFLCHNGEVNTLRGNLNWMRIREERMASPRFGDALAELFPIVQPDQSDSASIDNVVELLTHAGRPLAHAMAMLLPKAWENDSHMPPEQRAFHEHHAALMEPWDGPAAIAFTDGRHIGAVLDRNGLRPVRWLVTDDDRVVLASEAGALPIPANRIRAKGRLGPGQMLLLNTTLGRLLDDDDVRAEFASRRAYSRLTAEQVVDLETLVPDRVEARSTPSESVAPERLRQFGYTREELRMIIAPMATTAEEAVGSMGNDAPLAALSDRPQLLFSYFRQLFAQVTNPAIDPLRERIVMSLAAPLGPVGNLLDETGAHGWQVRLRHPVLDVAEMLALRAITEPALRAVTLPAVFPVDRGADGLPDALDALCRAAAATLRETSATLILSDRDASERLAPIPSLLAIAAVHHHLIREGLRSRTSLLSECGDARDVSHIALLVSFGGAAVHPYLALEVAGALGGDGGRGRYIKAIEKGLLKILSKMGISTLQSYRGAQLWEAVGLDPALIEQHFSGTPCRLGGRGMADVARDALARHAHAYHDSADGSLLDPGGEYHYRADGERHGWNPNVIAALQRAARAADAASYAAFSDAVNAAIESGPTLRGLLDFVEHAPVPREDVEPAASIVRRFATGAMSFGSISREAHETLAAAMNHLGGRSNTGEGGEDPARFGTPHNSAIKQIASARFGVTTEYLVSARELQIKIAQGAKPGEGGQLPGGKVDETIARIRHAMPGVTLISPPPHHDIYSIEDLKQLIYDLKNVNPSAIVSVKLVAEAGVGAVAAGVAKAGADLIVISGDSGGTGASPLSSIKRAGVPWELGLSETHQTLVLNGLRDHVRLQTDGQLKTGRDVVVAALLGADEFGFATAPLVAQGCVMMRKCHLNTCPVGIATQDPVLREKFAGRPEHVVNYFFFVAEEVRELMARLGVRRFGDLVGRVDRLCVREPRQHSLDLSALLHAPTAVGRRRPHRTTKAVPDAPCMDVVAPAIERGALVRATLPIRTSDRAVGAAISGEIARRYGGAGLPADTIVLRFEGSAGQSFGAFGVRGLTLELEGEANDYVAKGLSGGRVIVRTPRQGRFVARQNVIIGNTVLYGATSGELFVAGAAGERFAVRNSGATAVVEGAGDHACEYMTGGTVVILGDVGRNFAAGMSGGVVFLDGEPDQLRTEYASDTLEVEHLPDTEDERTLCHLIEAHARLTGSRRARAALAVWAETRRRFVRVMPLEYKRALARQSSSRGDPSDGTRYG
jgi:glutamate synthase domain-containing protein 2/glutamate synthase domain-containing protein 1/glutamate synthase domain-containing protein 3